MIGLIREFIVEELVLDDLDGDIGDDDDLLTTGLVDSLGVMRLVGFIQDEFAIEVPPEDVTIENFLSLATISSYIARNAVETERGQV